MSKKSYLPLQVRPQPEYCSGVKVPINIYCKLKVQCPLDIQTSLRHQGRVRNSQRGRFIKRLDIATWRRL